MQTRDQQYAAMIFTQVNEDVIPQGETYRKKYGSMAHKLPVLIRTAGLAQSLSFVEARGEMEHQKLLEHLGAAVGEPDLATCSRKVNLSQYIRLTHQVLSALLWYKRFAQSVLHVEASDEGEQTT